MTKVLKSVSAVALLAVLLVGAPMLLAIAGELPTGLGWTDLRQLLTTPDTTGAAFLWVITIVGWVAWALFSVCVVVEIINHLGRRRIVIRLPGLGLGQRLAGGLVAAAFALTTMQGSQIAIAETHTPVAVTAVASGAPTRVTPMETQKPAESAVHVHVVKSGEYLWQIAETYYGDGAQFPRIAQANKIDPFSDLAVGQKLVVPGITHTNPTKVTKVAEQTVTIPATVTVGPGDSLWSFAQTHLGDGHRWPEIHRLNTDLITDPDLLDDGWVLKMPTPAINTKTVEHPPKTVETTPQTKTETTTKTQAPQTTVPQAPQTTVMPTPQSPTETQTPQEVAGTDGHEGTGLVVPAALAGVGLLLTAGLVTTLNRRRRRQLAQRRPGQKITLPGEQAQRLESALRAQEPVDTVQALDTILRVIAEHHHTNQLPLPTLTAARLAATRIDLLLAAPALDAPEGVELTADGAVWTIHANQLSVFTDRADEVAGVNAPWPALVTLGRDDDGANILLDLESAAALTITTEDHDTAHALLRGLALDLAVAPWASELNLTLVGDVCPNLEKAMGEPTITRVQDVEELLTSLEARAELQRSVITDANTTLGQIRIDPTAADLVDPEIILLDHTLDPQIAQRLAALLSDLPRTAVATVTTAPVDVPNAWRFQLGGDPLIGRLRPHDWRLHPQTVDTATYLALLDGLHSSRQLETTPAPWWNHDPLQTLNAPDEDPVTPTATITQLPVSRAVTLPTPAPAVGKQPPVEVGQKRAPLSLAPLLGDLDLADIYDDEPTDDHHTNEVAVDLSGPPPVEPLADPEEIAEVHFLHPTLRVLGPVDLVCTRGEFTGVGKVGAMEILMHLMDHPGTSAKDLADTVMISVTTARPKITHLRAWLGTHPEGTLYLPRGSAAGGYRLHPDVRSDWHILQDLIAGGANRASTTSLVKALKLVRGAPFEGTGHGFAFAEAIRVDMISTITDVALQLVDRALDSNDVDLARWASAHALDVDPESESLLAARIRTEYQAGNMTEVERLIGRVNRNARSLDVDLRETTVEIIHQAGAR